MSRSLRMPFVMLRVLVMLMIPEVISWVIPGVISVGVTSILAVHATPSSAELSFSRWISEFEERCDLISEVSDAWVEELKTDTILIVIYPQQISPLVLDWVGRGGTLMLALNERSAPSAQRLLEQLDLTSAPISEQDRGVQGAWPFPQSQLGDAQNMSPFISPWLMVSPISFLEGTSWFKGGIAPVAIDERGRSVGYRVRYGRGNFTLLGDADALSDELLSVSLNRRFAKSLMWWLTKRSRDQDASCSVAWVTPKGAVRSRREEQSLKVKLERLGQSIKEWWAQLPDHRQAKSILTSLYFGLALFFVFLINVLTSRQEWRRGFIQKRRR